MVLRLVFFFITLTTVALVHIVAEEFSLYWRYLWLDMPVHFLGGVVCAFGLSILPFFRIHLPERFTTRQAYLFFTLIVGCLWEVFEYTYNIMGTDANLVLDTGIDITFDLLGALFGYLFIQKSKIF